MRNFIRSCSVVIVNDGDFVKICRILTGRVNTFRKHDDQYIPIIKSARAIIQLIPTPLDIREWYIGECVDMWELSQSPSHITLD